MAALISLKLKHVNLHEKSVIQNPREVNTKFARRIDTFFVKDFEDAEQWLKVWIEHLDNVELYGPDDPLFPVRTASSISNKGFIANGFERRNYKSTEPVRKIINQAFDRVGLPAFGPHAFRHMLARHASNTCKSVAEFVATAQNLGHSDVLTTLRSYGQISRERQRELVTGLKPDEL